MSDVSKLFEFFVNTDIEWVVHYPVFMNTFCFAHHLAQTAAQNLPNPTEEYFRTRFIRHDWSNLLPSFTYTSDVEMFVGLDEAIIEARSQGHMIQDFAVFPFTDYNQSEIFVRRYPTQSQNSEKTYLITDVEVTARSMLKRWKEEGRLPLEMTAELPNLKPQDIIIRSSSSRCIRDLVGTHQKIYLMSAPMSWYFSQNKTKYTSIPITSEPVSTNIVIRANSGIAEKQVNHFIKDLKTYYSSIYNGGSNVDLINEDLCKAYARMAKTIGQQHPFPDLAAPPAYRPKDVDEPPSIRYQKILDKHHNEPGTSAQATKT